MPTTPTTSMPPLPPERNRNSSFTRKRKPSNTTLADVNGPACKYFQAKQQMLHRRQQNNVTSQLDIDMSFLHSVLPNMKAMDERQKMRFKRRILDLAEDILYPQLNCKVSSSSTNGQSKDSSMRTSSMDTLAGNFFIKGAPPMPTDDNAADGNNTSACRKKLNWKEILI
nr:unnamed protein product [Callosobruchus analis]